MKRGVRRKKTHFLYVPRFLLFRVLIKHSFCVPGAFFLPNLLLRFQYFSAYMWECGKVINGAHLDIEYQWNGKSRRSRFQTERWSNWIIESHIKWIAYINCILSWWFMGSSLKSKVINNMKINALRALMCIQGLNTHKHMSNFYSFSANRPPCIIRLATIVRLYAHYIEMCILSACISFSMF